MAEVNQIKHDNSPKLLIETEDDLDMYRKDAIDAVTFRIAYNILNAKSIHNSFKPDMAHQIFGSSESIYGYRNLNIDLYYLHNSARCYVDINYSAKLEGPRHKIDDIRKSLNVWLPEHYATDQEGFIRILNEEKHDFMFGEVLSNMRTTRKVFSDESISCQYKVTLCDTNDADFIIFHQRFETFIIWFIDGANYIDLQDDRWMIFYVYEEAIDRTTNTLYRSPVGFCTVYKFYSYPNSIRPRISQFFILPTHQKHGIGTKLYSTVFDYLKRLPDVTDITVEEPTDILQKIRDCTDSVRVYRDMLEKNIKIDYSGSNKRGINNIIRSLKISKRQSQRVYDILSAYVARKINCDEYTKVIDKIKERIINEHERDQYGSKKRCSLNRAAVFTDADKKTAIEGECKKYVDCIEQTLNRIINMLLLPES